METAVAFHASGCAPLHTPVFPVRRMHNERCASGSEDVEAPADGMVLQRSPEHIRSDNGPELIARDLRRWLADTGAKSSLSRAGSPWENGYRESRQTRFFAGLSNTSTSNGA
jgi:transposase InsO family protein